MNEKMQTLVMEWGIPAAIGLAVLGGCEASTYIESQKTPEVRAAEAAEKEKRPTLPEAIGNIVRPALGL